MRKAALFIFLLISIFFLSEFPVDAARGISVISDLSHRSGKLGAYRALIIGINDYKDPQIPDLETAINDAKTMAELLRERYGFQVKLLLNRKATRKAIYQALRNLASSSKPDDSVLIYYAGHGDLDRTYDDGWWIPADAKGGDPITYLDNVQVQKSMRSMKARHVLLISDSCYSGTLFGQARALPQVIDNKYYLNLYNEKSRWGMTSGNKTPVSDAGSGGHSIFAYQLIKELRKNEKPYISTQEIYTRIAPLVVNNSEQVPICRPIRNTGDQGGEFVFVANFRKAVSVKKSISVKTEPVQLPPEGGISFDDILKAEELQRQTKKNWKNWQRARQKDYQKVRQIDGSKNLTSKQKTVAWQRFLAAVSQDNPYSRRDDKWRSYASSRVSHWDNVKPAKKIEPSSSKSFTDSESEITGRDDKLVDEKPKHASLSPKDSKPKPHAVNPAEPRTGKGKTVVKQPPIKPQKKLSQKPKHASLGPKDSKPKPPAFNPTEPWTGNWKVKGDMYGEMYFKLKQSGKKVRSLRGSSYELKGKVIGDRLKGWYKGSLGHYADIKLEIAKDGKTFKGTSDATYAMNYILEGERQ